MTDFMELEQMVLGEAAETWDYENDSLALAIGAAADVAAASEPDLWFAEKHMRNIRRIQADVEMTARAFRAEIARLSEQLAEIEGVAGRKVAWHESMVEGFHRALEREGVIGATLTVPSGTSRLRKADPELVVEDEGEFRTFVADNKLEGDLLNKVPEPSISKRGVAKLLRPLEEGEPGTVSRLVDPDGQPVPGVSVRFRHKTHSVKAVEG